MCAYKSYAIRPFTHTNVCENCVSKPQKVIKKCSNLLGRHRHPRPARRARPLPPPARPPCAVRRRRASTPTRTRTPTRSSTPRSLESCPTGSASGLSTPPTATARMLAGEVSGIFKTTAYILYCTQKNSNDIQINRYCFPVWGAPGGV